MGVREALKFYYLNSDGIERPMRTLVALAGVALLVSASAAPVPVEIQAKELIVNGSFEEGPAVTEWIWVDEKSEKIKGWVVVHGQIDYIGTLWKASDGKRSLDLHGSPGYGGVKQTIKTEKGRTYRVTFDMAGTPGGIPAKKSIEVSAGKLRKSFEFDSTGMTNEKMGWAKQSWDFKAEEAETVLEFATAEKVDPNQGPALDNVSVKLFK